jgi:hypothetical protein
MDQENQVKYLNDERAYNALREEDKRDFQLQVADRARAYQKLDDQQKKEYEQRLIDQGRAFELEQIKRKEDFEIDKLEKQQDFQRELFEKEKEEKEKLPATFYADKYYENDSDKGENRKIFEDNKIKRKIIDKFSSSQYGGFLNGGENDRDAAAMLKNPKDKDVGKVFYDLETGEIKRFRKTTDGYEFEKIKNIDTFVEEPAPKGSTKEEKDAEIDKRFKFFSDDQKKIIEDIQKNKPDDFGTGA